MILVIDIGNTNITMGLFKNDQLFKRDTLLTQSRQFFLFFKRCFSKYDIEKVIVSSVVPRVTRKLEQVFKRLKIKGALILGKNLIVPIKNRYQFPKEVGQDRLVNAFAAIKFYGYPVIVVDFGTAITFDIISKKKEYLGGMILPGLETSLSSLAEKTALLPKIKLSGPPKDLIGKNTRQSMLSGIFFGFAGLTDGVIKKLKQKLGEDILVIGTGGNIKIISQLCQELNVVDINLTLKGLNSIGSSF